MQEIAQRLGPAILCAVRHQPHTAVDIPGQNEDAVARSTKRRTHGSKTLVGINQQGEMLRMFNAPAIAAGRQQVVDIHTALDAAVQWKI